MGEDEAALGEEVTAVLGEEAVAAARAAVLADLGAPAADIAGADLAADTSRVVSVAGGGVPAGPVEECLTVTAVLAGDIVPADSAAPAADTVRVPMAASEAEEERVTVREDSAADAVRVVMAVSEAAQITGREASEVEGPAGLKEVTPGLVDRVATQRKVAGFRHRVAGNLTAFLVFPQMAG